MRTLALVVLLAGCYNYDQFRTDYDPVFCDKVFECETDEALPYLPYESAEDCVTFRQDLREDEADPDCAFDASAAEQCLEETANLACPSYQQGDSPVSCGLVCEGEEG